MLTANEEIGNVEHRRLQPGPGRHRSHPSSTQKHILLRWKRLCGNGNSTAYNTIDAIILIRLREKMEVHLCTVFQSTCNPIILTRYAFKHRMLQEHDEIYRLCTHTATSTNATF